MGLLRALILSVVFSLVLAVVADSCGGSAPRRVRDPIPNCHPGWTMTGKSREGHTCTRPTPQTRGLRVGKETCGQGFEVVSRRRNAANRVIAYTCARSGATS